MSPAPIAIIGGGPCGLTFARLLETAGIEYVVFERDASSVSAPYYQGGTLDLHPETGQEALRRAGLSDKFEKLARRDATTMVIQDLYGKHLFRFGEGSDRPEIDRLQLRQMLLDSLPANRIRWGKALESAEKDESSKETGAASWILRFKDGSSESGFRLIVGADGAWSKLRSLVCII
jgi:2-polyprenyl-6-methoxyphenol hydroxylase-like FAD-dependent oxidoreductase